MKRKTPLYLAMSALVGFAMSASAEEIFLFEATPITDSGFSADITQRYIFAETETTVFCDGPGTGNLQTVGAADNSLIVDNYVTINDADGQSICTGGNPTLPVIGGTNCFSSGAETGIGNPIETVFQGATAPVDLFDGRNDLVFKLWDWGGVYGNTALELALPENCSASTTNLCAAQHFDIGNVNVSDDGEYLYVEFEITELGWYLDETHVAVGELADMVNRAGNPRPGQFPWSCENSGNLDAEALYSSCVAEIPLDGLNGEINIAAHASVFNLVNGVYIGDETAWGAACPSEGGDAEGTRFTERGNWGTYFKYEIK